jgi:hypothetical protein
VETESREEARIGAPSRSLAGGLRYLLSWRRSVSQDSSSHGVTRALPSLITLRTIGAERILSLTTTAMRWFMCDRVRSSRRLAVSGASWIISQLNLRTTRLSAHAHRVAKV